MAQTDILKVMNGSFIWGPCNELINLVKRLSFGVQ